MIHIRHNPLKARGNQWYRDKDIRPMSTLCGAPCDYYDVLVRDTQRKKFNVNDAFWLSKGGFCSKCLEELKKL